jgi:hypothetical protein
MNVSRTEALVNCSVTFATQWIRFAYAPAAKLDGIFLAGKCDQNLLKEDLKMPIFSFLLKRRLLQSLLGGASRRTQTHRTGGLVGGSFRKAVFAGITAMLVKRMLRRKSF